MKKHKVVRVKLDIGLPVQYQNISRPLSDEPPLIDMSVLKPTADLVATISKALSPMRPYQPYELPAVAPSPPLIDPIPDAEMIAETAAEPAPKDKREVVRTHVSYLSPLLQEPDLTVSKFRKKMRTVDFDTLVGTGLSGTLAVQLLAQSVGCYFAIVRKGVENTHSDKRVEGFVGKRWVFVDDLICTGASRERVRVAMEEFCREENFESEYVGDYLYYSNKFRPKEDGNA